jgi:hypothetical protein
MTPTTDDPREDAFAGKVREGGSRKHKREEVPKRFGSEEGRVGRGRGGCRPRESLLPAAFA